MSSNIKFDKETLIKHRFWIALGVFVPLWLVAWLVLWLGVSGQVVEKKKQYKESVDAVGKVTDPKTLYYTNPMNEKKDTLTGRKNTIWWEVWSPQGNLMVDWPANDQTPQLSDLKNLPFGTPIKDDDARGITATRVRQEYRDVLYKPWFDERRSEFYAWAGPMTLDFDRVINLAPIDKHPEYPLTNEEMWLNAETVWVKRELLWIIRRTIDTIAYFHPVSPAGQDEALPAGIVARHRFRNSNWELDLQLKRGDNKQLFISEASTLKNINAGKRTLPLREIKIQLAQASASDPNQLVPGPEVKVQGEPVPWNKTAKIGKDPVTGKEWRVDQYPFNDKQRIYATQVFTWGTSPIKQIDAIELGYQSSRTAFQKLRGLKPDDDSAPAPASTTQQAGPGPGAGGGIMGGGPGVAQAAGGGDQAQVKTSNSPLGINAKRYVQVTEQVRRMPIGIVVAIDQAHIEDLMSQFVNSRLRFQPTQVQWQQDTRGLKPPEEAPKRGDNPPMAGRPMMPGGVGMMPGGPGGAGMGGGMAMMQGMQDRMQGMMMQGGMRQGGGMMMPPPGVGGGMGPGGGGAGPKPGAGGVQPGAGQTTQTSPATGEESDPNLVEFALYGIISLYDRYQPPAAAAGGTQQAAPAAGAGQQAPPAQGGAPKADEQPKPDAAPKADEPPKPDAAPKAEDKKTDDKPVGGEVKKSGENKGS